jgi:hypothetical protein
MITFFFFPLDLVSDLVKVTNRKRRRTKGRLLLLLLLLVFCIPRNEKQPSRLTACLVAAAELIYFPFEKESTLL